MDDKCERAGADIGLLSCILFLAASIRFLRSHIEAALVKEREKLPVSQFDSKKFASNHRDCWRQMQLKKSSEFGEGVLDQMAGLIGGCLKTVANDETKDCIDILGDVSMQLRVQMRLLRTVLAENGLADAEAPPVLFAFDEASTLLHPIKLSNVLNIRPAFHSLRYALNAFLPADSKEVNFFAVVIWAACPIFRPPR